MNTILSQHNYNENETDRIHTAAVTDTTTVKLKLYLTRAILD